MQATIDHAIFTLLGLCLTFAAHALIRARRISHGLPLWGWLLALLLIGLGVAISATGWPDQLATKISPRRIELLVVLGLIMLVVAIGTLTTYARAYLTQQKNERALILAREAQALDVSNIKNQFLANMSHEIRTPLTAILGYAELLHTRELDENDRYVHANTIHRNAEHLLDLINDILDLSKIEAGRMAIVPQPTDLKLAFADVTELLRWKASEKGISLTTELARDLPATITVDALRFRQILVNIIGNAVKFTQVGSVRVHAARGEGNTLRIAVADTGVGIPREQLPILFDRFQQGDASMTRRFGGTGLGLAISKKLAGMMGGDIHVASTLGEGSTFTITIMAPPCEAATHALPTPPQPQPASSPAGAGELPLSGLRILYAEDGPDNQRLISLLLRKGGAEVTVVEHGLLLVDMMIRASREGQAFDLVLSDMQMPEMDGYAATRRLRELGFTTPILALTAHAMSGEREKCMDAGCTGFLTKPIDRAALIKACAIAVPKVPKVTSKAA
jgi:signal transduction histidine kinase